MSAVVGTTHILCSIGSGTDQVWAAARAGIGRICNSRVMDRNADPIQMGLVPEDALMELAPEIDALPLPSRARRILRLAATSFRTAAADLEGPVPVCVGLPELASEETLWLKHFLAYLQKLTGVAVDQARSRVVAKGRAAALLALEGALGLLEEEPAATIVVGGVDSYLDLRLLGTLDNEQRILGPSVMDGFIPGEGAAFYTLTAGAPQQRGRGQAVIDAAGSAADRGHRYGTEVARGEGLALALDAMRKRLRSPRPVSTTFAGLNGESFDAKAWGVARMRHSDLFAASAVVEHPADRFGDTGAATGAILVALAARAMSSGTRLGPSLVWAASDRESRGCAFMSGTDDRFE